MRINKIGCVCFIIPLLISGCGFGGNKDMNSEHFSSEKQTIVSQKYEEDKEINKSNNSLESKSTELIGEEFGNSPQSKGDEKLHCEPSSEIVNAPFSSFLLQVDDIVFKYEYKHSLNDFLQQFNSEKYYFRLYDDSNYVEVNFNKLMAWNDYESIYIFNNDYEHYCVSVVVQNVSTETCTLDNCAVRELYLDDAYEGQIYLPKGLPFGRDLDYYEKEDFSFSALQTYLEKMVDESIDDSCYYAYATVSNLNKNLLLRSSDGLQYYIVACGSEETIYVDERSTEESGSTMGGASLIEIPYFLIGFTIDKDTAMVGKISFKTLFQSDWIVLEDMD